MERRYRYVCMYGQDWMANSLIRILDGEVLLLFVCRAREEGAGSKWLFGPEGE